MAWSRILATDKKLIREASKKYWETKRGKKDEQQRITDF